MVDKNIIKNTCSYKEFNEESRLYWFDFKQKKFLHNIDTFYYSVKFKNDFRKMTNDHAVLAFREFFSDKFLQMEETGNKYAATLSVLFPGCGSALNLKPFTYAGFYNICLECPEYFDIFFAPSVPSGPDDSDSVTSECVVQIRSYMLWMYGVKNAYEMSYQYIESIAEFFGLSVDFVQENRIDYAWHTNYLQNPEKFFTADNLYKMRVDRFRDALFHTSKVGSEEHEVDYIAMGKRSDKIFIRIYLKSKEVVQKGYKPWFFKVWLFNGLINRFDMFVYEYAFLKHSWKAIDLGRLQFYVDYGTDEEYKKICRKILAGREKHSDDYIRKLANLLTPKVTLVMNVEFQTMRKHTKTYELIPFYDNSVMLNSKRIYDYLDNRKLICDYLTTHVFRLVEMSTDENVLDSNKSRRENCAFWKALKACKITDCFVPDTKQELVRTYTRRLNAELVKSRAVKAAVTFGIYQRGINDDSPLQDCLEALCTLNDNDIQDALRFKNKKIRQFNANELANVDKLESQPSNIAFVDTATGEYYSFD